MTNRDVDINMKRGLVFTKYGTRAASTRQRFSQMMPYLEARGISITLVPLLDNHYLQGWFARGDRPALRIVIAYLARLRWLMRARQYDFLWIHYELFPYLPGWLECLAAMAGKPILYEADDAIFHQYDQHRLPLVRALLGQKLRRLLRRTRLAICGNAYLETYVARDCSATIIVPTTVDISHYLPAGTHSARALPVIGWIGSPTTWAFVAPVVPLLRELVETGRAQVRVIGSGQQANAAMPFTFSDWTEASEIADIQAMDIGIMPLPDEPWARGKCGYKLIQYMACGLPVVASPVGVNSAIVTPDENGFLATDGAQWRAALEALLIDAPLRARMGQAGRLRASQAYSLQVHGPRLAEAVAAAIH
jgi:glycosyltransferase involved in cell wall biosynthesis